MLNWLLRNIAASPFIFLVALTMITNCGSASYPQVYKFSSVDVDGNLAKRERSYIAIHLALMEQKWTIEFADFSEGIIHAKACHFREYDICGTVEVKMDVEGNITIQKKPLYYFPTNLEDDLHRWMSELRPIWGKYRLYRDDQLVKESEKYGFLPAQEGTEEEATEDPNE